MAASGVVRRATAASALLAVAVGALGVVVIRRGDDGGLDPWRSVLVAWGVAPFALAWWVARAETRRASRVPLLWFTVIPGAVAALISYFALLPSLLLLVVGAVGASGGTARGEGAPRGRAVAGGLLFALGWIAGFRVTFASADYRCVATAAASRCTSDVVTIAEALAALALLALGCAAALWLTRDAAAGAGTLGA